MILVTICGNFAADPTPVLASSLSLDDPTIYTYTGVSPQLGVPYTHKSIYVLKVDGKEVFCVESGILATEGEGYLPEDYIDAKKDKLAKIAYYGYTNTNQTHYDYAVTQVMIWEELGDQYISSNIPNYHERKAEIMALVDKHDTLPSWNNQEVNVSVGESITLIDANNVLSDMTLESNDTNAALSQNGNNLTITPDANFKNGSITYRKVPQNQVGTSIVYRKPGRQSMVEFHLDSPKQASVKVNEQLGQVQIDKTGEEFGTTMVSENYSLEGAVYDIYTENGVKVTSMTTDQYGKATSAPIKLGKYYALERTAPNGYLLNENKIPFELKYAGQTVKVTSTSIAQEEQEQKGNATLVKEDSETGATPQGAASLDGAVYELHRTSNDELVETVTTQGGKATVQNLYLDDYYWIEVAAPEGYLIDEEKHHFKLAYAGQTVETAVQSTTVKEEVIKGGFDLVKFGSYDWQTTSSNLPSAKEIKPLENVEFSVFSDTTGKLVQKGLTDSEGYLEFTELPYDTYTVKETKTPEGYEPAKDFKVTIHEENETHHYSVENKVIEETLKVVKVDAETGKTIPRADAGFQIRSLQNGELVSMPKLNEDGVTDIFYTNEEGYLITPERLPYGEYELIEVEAPEGYVLAKEPMKFTVDGSNDGLIEIRFEDMSQKGIVDFTKTGQTPIDVAISESEYGQVYEFIYDYQPIADVTYRIEAAEDIITNDGTLRAKKGETVATMTTDELGEWQSPELYLGKYQAIEVSAPNGFVVDPTPIAFELEYSGQQVALTSASLAATNDFQSLDIQLFKNEEAVSSWQDNRPEIETIQGTDKVFGLFTREAQNLSEELQVPADALVGYQTVKGGVAAFEVKLPQGKYYLKEIDAGDAHIISDAEYDFEFTAENNHATFPIHIYQDAVAYGTETEELVGTPILNTLHFNEFSIKKVNEHAIFDKETGMTFDYSLLGTGAVFTLEDESGEVIQEVTIDEDGIGVFENIPVGTFYLKETAPSDAYYLLRDETIRIESTKDGVKAFDENNQLIGEQSSGTEESEGNTILFEVKNDLKKGTAELTKSDVSTGKLLPDTGVRILDQDKNVIAEGRTNDKGVFTFKDLPKGVYYFQEFDAPDGYELDETPMKFEIKEDGEVVKCQMTNQKIQASPGTGDTTNTEIFGLVMVTALTSLGLCVRRRKTKVESE